MTWFKIKKFIRFYLLAIIVSTLMMVLTILIFWETQVRASTRNNNLFEIQSTNAQAAIEKRMQDYIQILKGAQGLLRVSDSVYRQEWREYVMLLDIEENYPGVQGIGYTVFVKPDELSAFEQRIQEGSYPDFRVWPSGERDIYSAIVYLEPFDLRNRRAFGYDMFSDSIRREAMIRARDSGNPALSGMVQLVQETGVGVQKGFLLYLPIYDKKAIPLTEAQRQASITGFAYSPFRVNDLMQGILAPRFDHMNIEIYDGEEISENTLLYTKESNLNNFADHPQQLYRRSSLQIGEHSWQLIFSARNDFGYGSDFPWYILAGGILTSTLVFFSLYSMANIRRSTQLNEVITDNATAAIFILNTKDYCTFMNPAAEILTGYTFDEIQQDTLHHMVHHSHADGTVYKASDCPIIQTLKSKKTLINYEDYFIRKNGQLIRVSINARPIYENGSIAKFLLEARDITREKSSEEALKEKNRNLQTLNNIGKNLSAELGMKKLLQIVTDSCTELTGAKYGAFFYNQGSGHEEKFRLYTLSGTENQEFSGFPMPHHTDLFEATFLREQIIRSDDISQDPRFADHQAFREMQEGPLWVKSYLAVPVISGSGQVFGGLLFGHPKAGVFDQHAEEMAGSIASQAAIAIDNSRLFEAISNKNTELLQINDELDQFVYTASHDLKAPVLNIEGLIYALDKALQEEKTERIPQIFSLMKTSLLKFKETIEALTDVARTNKNLDEEASTIKLEEILDDIRLSIRDMLEGQEVRFHYDLECGQIRFSKTNLRSILLNLITNGVKYRSEERSPEIWISCKPTPEGLVLKVADNGLGFPENQYAKVFMMFKRYHTHVEGTGVGLYLVKRIIENSGGTISVKSTPGQGTCFSINIPQ